MAPVAFSSIIDEVFRSQVLAMPASGEVLMVDALVSGLLLGFSLIIAIGAQNAFVLRQGLRGEHVFAVCLTCAVSDAILIMVGVAGFGAVVRTVPWIEPVMRYGGALFIAFYGLRSLRAAFLDHGALVASQGNGGSLAAALTTCLAFTWLNPHVYLDTLVLLGSISTGYAGHGLAFGSGAVLASFLFFFALGYGARYLQPFFARPSAWRVLDALIGMTMCGLAVKLAI